MNIKQRVAWTLYTGVSAGVIAALLAVGFMLWLASPASSQVRKCGDRASMISVLVKKYQETPRALGLSSANRIAMEIYASEKGTWSILMTTIRGTTCIMAAGHSWQQMMLNSGDGT